MKKVIISLASMFMMLLVACSGSSSYNPETCSKLETMAREKQELTESDYNQMIDQMVAACKILAEKKTQIGDDKDAMREFRNSEEGKQLLTYSLGFAFYLESEKNNLPEGSLKKLAEAKTELEKLNLKD